MQFRAPRHLRAPQWLAAASLVLGACSFSHPFDDECTTAAECEGTQQCTQGLCVTGPIGGSGGGTGGSGGGAGGTGGVTLDSDVGGMGGSDMALDQGPGPDMATAWPPTVPAFCSQIYGQPVNRAWDENTIRLGMLMPSTGDLGAVGPPIEKAAFLAIDEINQSGGLGQKKFAIIACDTGTDPVQAVAAATWLIDEAHVPAIIGPAASSAALQVFSDVALNRGTVLISPSATSPALTDQQDNNLLWRTAPSDAIQGRAISAYLQAADLQKVAVINRNDTYGNGLAEAVRSALCTSRVCDDSNFFNRRYDPADIASLLAVSGQVREFAPDALVAVAFVTDGIELVNMADGIGVTRLLLTDGTRDPNLLTGVRNPEALREAVGTAPASPAGDTFAAFSSRYSSQWGEAPGVFNAQAYDAMYLLGFAIGGLGDTPITGANIALGLARLSAGERIEAGPTNWGRGVGILQDGADTTIDYVGAAGELNFDDKGEAPGDIEGWRFNLEDESVEALGTMFTAAGEYFPVAEPVEAEDMGVTDDAG